MTDAEKLLAIEEIKQLKARYFQCVDCKDWKGFLAVFASDVEMDESDTFSAFDPISGESRVYGRPELLANIDTSTWKAKGRKQIVAMGTPPFESTVHWGFNPQITLQSDDAASGVWAMQDLLRFPASHPITEIRGIGHYHETYRRIDGRWFIQTTRLTRLRIDVC